MPWFVMEPPKACKGFTKELAEGTSRDFANRLSTDEEAGHNLDLWDRLEERGEFSKSGLI